MTSFVAKEIHEGGFMPTFKVQGQIYHRYGSLLPEDDKNPQFVQIYFLGDPSTEANMRWNRIPTLNKEIISSLQDMLHSHNGYIKIFKTALEKMASEEKQIKICPDKTPLGEHVRRFNAPTFNEVAIVMVGSDFGPRDIVLQKRSNEVQHVADTHRSYDALQYLLLFWQGEDGYNFGFPQRNPFTRETIHGKKVSAASFYAYQIMMRQNQENHILKSRSLFHQYIVDMYAKIESERLRYIRTHQKELRSESYIHLVDAISNDPNPYELGKRVILPSSVIGSPRHMHEYTQDAMTYVRNYGRPDLFITLTCNPRWPEILDNLFPGQSSADRHDLNARVFEQKVNRLMSAIRKSHIFGVPKCFMYTIEWQKRGLPHCHLLLWLEEKIKSTDIDRIIRAEIPDFNTDPLLHTAVSGHTIHGPCGVLNRNCPCMVDGKCSKKFPKELISETQTGEDSYPLYKRRKPADGGFTTIIKKGKDEIEIEIDNRWIVPYCPLLLKMFDAHINVEWCHSVKAIKYICKYINKGSDQAVFEVHGNEQIHDEVKIFQVGRYISSNEAVWRILGFPIHERSPKVEHLAVHLENGQRLYFRPGTLHQQILEPPQTTLTGFFELCRQEPFAKTLLYCDVPRFFTWNFSHKK